MRNQSQRCGIEQLTGLLFLRCISVTNANAVQIGPTQIRTRKIRALKASNANELRVGRQTVPAKDRIGKVYVAQVGISKAVASNDRPAQRCAVRGTRSAERCSIEIYAGNVCPIEIRLA